MSWMPRWSASSPWVSTCRSTTLFGISDASGKRAHSTWSSSPSAPSSLDGLRFRLATPRTFSTWCRFSTGWRRTTPHCWGDASRTTEAGTPPSMRADRTASGSHHAVIVDRRNQERMPAHPDELAEAVEEGVTMRWLTTVSSVEDKQLVLEKMRLNDSGFPEPTGEFESTTPTRSSSPSVRIPTSHSSQANGCQDRRRGGRGFPGNVGGSKWHLRRWRCLPSAADSDGGHRTRQASRPRHRRLPRRT